MSKKGVQAVILAAGASTRMKSRRSKLLHELMGKALAVRAYEQARLICDEALFVVGHQAEELKSLLSEENPDYVLQDPPLGTGDALRKAVNHLSKSPSAPETLFIAGGDSVLLRPESLKQLAEVHSERAAVMSLITCHWPEPSTYGRIIRDKAGNVQRIVEYKNANDEEKSLSEINAGFYLVDYKALKEALPSLKKNSVSGEFYLTDLVEYFYSQNQLVLALQLSDFRECLGINNPLELSNAQTVLRERILERHLLEGVFIQDPQSVWIDEDVELASDVQIGPGCILSGKTKLEPGVRLEAYCIIRESIIGRDSLVKAFSVVENADLANEVEVGPFARLRPKTKLSKKVKIGNFVEVKNSRFHPGSKANHLSYIGDADIGEASNIGAGTITCNYDGFAKHPTKLGKSVFVGSNTSLVAPLEIGDNAIVGAGSVITKEVEAGALAVERSEQKNFAKAADRFRSRRAKGDN